ncbi:nucleotidyl transferase AbiEii/AbiGii toxin family protein [Candidatus Poriferisocius sp.]|uniref:nucleotidyl transferase AbiEii/AbiGii toxin family protein n=1 Tax=Candidatus Poriferisocius sp. TaxID=3101276 RepID=UPI003B015487
MSRLCGSDNTASGKPCRNPAASCPIPHHRFSRRKVSSRSQAKLPPITAEAVTANLTKRESDRCWQMPLVSADPGRFRQLRDLAAAETGLPAAQITHDYHLHRTLYGLGSTLPSSSPLVDTNDEATVIGESWAFAGGTALASAHRLVDRFSEDVDLVAFVPPSVGRSSLDRTLRRGLISAAAHAANPDPASHRIPGSGSVATANIRIAGGIVVRVDAATMAPRAGTPNPDVVLLHPYSLMGRYADSGDLEAHPELGGYAVDGLAVQVTAANKMAALHEAAVQNRLDQVRQRGRDLYDLACIANSDGHASAAKEHIADIAGHTVRTARTRRGNAGRPEGGYSTSQVFDPRTAPGEALRVGYEQMQPMIFGSYRPMFEEALAAAKTLD